MTAAKLPPPRLIDLLSGTGEIPCSICRRSLSASDDGIGYDARPINSGWCCDQCYRNVVLPARRKRRETPDE